MYFLCVRKSVYKLLMWEESKVQHLFAYKQKASWLNCCNVSTHGCTR